MKAPQTNIKQLRFLLVNQYKKQYFCIVFRIYLQYGH